MKNIGIFFMAQSPILKLLAIALLLSSCSKEEITRPNIILIMVDDMGYSDIGCYGGEIPTPNIDRLAAEGIRFSSFYNGARCCPTRASLLTGLYPHQTGVGQMTNSPKGENFNWGTPGYQGYLNEHCVTIAEVLREAGYHTYMTGKWHLGYHKQERYPLQRGFDKYYGIIPGASSYFKPQGNRPLTYMNQHLQPPGEGFYTTDAFTDTAISFIKSREDENPFFLYLAYNAPHWPLQAKEEDIEKFVGHYMEGWDVLRDKRLQRQKEMGLLSQDQELSPRDFRVRPWSEVDPDQQIRSDYRMAVYAAQIFSVDENIGKLIGSLKENGDLQNTIIFFLSDNGGCAEMYDEFGSKPDSLINDPNYSGAVSYGISWANLSNTPFFEYKVRTYEGGISTPLIVNWPYKLQARSGLIVHDPAVILDIMPTILEVSGATYPDIFHNGSKIFPIEGESLVPVLNGDSNQLHDYIYWEHQGNCAVRKGNFKAVKKLEDKNWKLFDLTDDRSEQYDVSDQFPEITKDLGEHWEKWANTKYVLPKRKDVIN